MRIFKNTTPFPIVLETENGKIVVMPNQEICLEESIDTPQEVLLQNTANILPESGKQDIESSLKKRFGHRFGKK